MGLMVLGESLQTADMAATPPTFFHRFTMNKLSELKAVRLWVVKYGTPSFSDLGLELRTAYQSDGSGRTLLATSSKTWTLTEISTANYSVKEIWFDWDQAPLLKNDVEYTLNLTAGSYSGDDTNHLAWVRTWPDPIVSFTGDDDASLLGKYPFHVGLITREVRL